jgi:hypothetical protein
MDRKPDIFLTVTGDAFLFTVRSCYIEKQVKAYYEEENYYVVRILPPVPQYGGGDDVEIFALTARPNGGILYPINKWPAKVYVGQILNREFYLLGDRGGDVSVDFHGELYQTYDEAKAVTDRYAEKLMKNRLYETL